MQYVARLSMLFLITATPALSQASMSGERMQPIARCETSPIDLMSDIRIKPYVRTSTAPEVPQSTHGRNVRGLAFQPTGYKLSFEMKALPMRNGQFCASIANMTVQSGFEPPQVWIDPNVRPGSCQYKVIYDHEVEHIAHFHDYLRDFESSLTSHMAQLNSTNRMTVSESGIDRGFQDLTSRVQQSVQSLHQRAVSRMVARDMSIDTPQEYRRLANLCR